MTSVQTSMGEVDAAVYARLTGDTTLMSMLASSAIQPAGATIYVPRVFGGMLILSVLTKAVFDFGAVPEGQPFPYITIGDNDEKPLHHFGTRGYLTTRKIGIWDSQFGGFQLSQRILARMNVLLDQQNQSTMPLATQKLVYMLFQQAIQLNDPGDDKILHTSVEYESFTQEI